MSKFLKLGIAAAVLATGVSVGMAFTDSSRDKVDTNLRISEKCLDFPSGTTNIITKSTTKARRAAPEGDFVVTNMMEGIDGLYNTSGVEWASNETMTEWTYTSTDTVSGQYEAGCYLFGVIEQEGGLFYGWRSELSANYHLEFDVTVDGNVNNFVYGFLYLDNSLYTTGVNVISFAPENPPMTAHLSVESQVPVGDVPMGLIFAPSGMAAGVTVSISNIELHCLKEKVPVGKLYNPETDSIAGIGYQNWMEGDFYVVDLDESTKIGYYLSRSVPYITGIVCEQNSLRLPINVNFENVTDYTFNTVRFYDNCDWSNASNLTDLYFPYGMTYFESGNFDYSPVSQLWIESNDFSVGNWSIRNDGADFYVHVPYGSYRSDYNYGGVTRVLIGDETADMPVPSNSNDYCVNLGNGDYASVRYESGNGFGITELFTANDSIVLPVAVPYSGGNYYVRTLGSPSGYVYEYNLLACAPNLKSVIVPDNYTKFNVRWQNPAQLCEFHMEGAPTNCYYNLNSSQSVYVRNRSQLSAYQSNSYFNSATILPDGWDYEWMTVNVGRKGEFAQTYIEMTDADWTLGLYVKVTGTLNATDLGNIKNLTNLLKLDLSEAEFTSLPSSFLSNASSLIEVVLPDAVTAIPSYAFQYCYKLEKVVAPGVETIDISAFYNCSKLSEFDISNVNSIGSSAFYSCYAYNPAAFSNELYSIGQTAFYNTGIKEVQLPQTMKSLSSSVFSNCKKLIRVVLPSSITTINSNAFNECYNLQEINLPEGITTIGYDAFNNCRSLNEITFPSTLQSIGYDILDGCSSLTSVKCKAIIPPTTNGDFTYGVDLNHCTLYIAPFAIDAYRAASDWSNFYIMKPLNEPVKNIYINRPMTFDLLSEDNAVLQENPNMTLDYGSSSSYYDNVGQLSASGDGTLSAGIFTIYHSFGRRQSPSTTDYRTTLVNNAENMRADSVLCSISFEKNRWHFISFQYDVQMSDVFGLNNTDFVIRQYNSANRAMGDGTTSNWETVPADGVLEAGKGYIIQAANNTTTESGSSRLAVVRFPSRNTVTKNRLFTSNNVIMPLEEYPSEFAHNRSWNLVGNPYPCYYDMHYLMDDFTTPIVLWRGTSYQAYSPVDDDIILRPNEAFFVQRPLDAEQMVFGADGRMHYSEAYYATNYDNSTPGIYYAPSRVASDGKRSVFNFNVEGGGSNDRARIVINEDASMDYEINRDASKFFAETCEGVEIYVDGDVKYDICERPLESGVATLGIRASKDEVYTMSLSGRYAAGCQVILTDNATGATVDLTKENYRFTAANGDSQNRFSVKFLFAGSSGIESVIAEFGNDAYVTVTAINGVTVCKGRLSEINVPSAGFYIISNGQETRKAFLK